MICPFCGEEADHTKILICEHVAEIGFICPSGHEFVRFKRMGKKYAMSVLQQLSAQSYLLPERRNKGHAQKEMRSVQ